MKKALRLSVLVLVSMGAAYLTGCATSGTHEEVANKYKAFKEAVANRPPAYVYTGDKAVDDVGILSAQIYGELIKYLEEYVSATENNRYYIGFMEDINTVVKEKQVSFPEAMAQVLAEYRQDDAKRPEGEEKVYPRVIEGYRAVEALKPANKLRELAPLGIQAAKVALQAQQLAGTLQRTYGSINFSDVEGMKKKVLVTASAAKIVEQTAFNVRALDFLQDQYNRNQEMKSYMQDDK